MTRKDRNWIVKKLRQSEGALDKALLNLREVHTVLDEERCFPFRQRIEEFSVVLIETQNILKELRQSF